MMNENEVYRGRQERRRWTLILFLLVLTGMAVLWGLGAHPVYADTGTQINLSLDDNLLNLDKSMGEPFIDGNSRTLVPFRGVMEAFGGTVTWDNDQRIASVVKNGTTVQVPIDANYILVNGTLKTNDTAAVIKGERTYLPIRAVLEAFGAGVAWDNQNRIVVIHTDGTVAEFPDAEKPSGTNTTAPAGEMNAMWISYLEYMNMPKTEVGFKAGVDAMFDRCKALGMNAVIVHVRSHGDAMYPSQYYPWSIFASGTQGTNPGYDPMAYMISAAHSRGLEFHAWINPYRVTGYGTYWSQVGASNPVKLWQSDGNPSNDRWALLHKGEYYLNPAIPEVRQMVIDGVREIVQNYDVDGIHFDDYFYPSVNDSDQAACFDKPEYDQSGSSMSIANWRRNNVDLLVKGVYEAVKGVDSQVVFGISPAGNLSNLRSNASYFVDIDKWLSQPGYVDYIMPQLYWGFETKDSSGNTAAYAYVNNLNSWINLADKGPVKLYVGLNMANAGSNVPDKNATSEWLRYNDIIARQVTTGRATGKVAGYAYFRYEYFNKDIAQKEVNNLVKVLN
ncbi:family 10 glycosylhydrolase [Aminipila butyrica]|uniref:Family 10 glycosylhydrolase n=1 Tax=Aminipila butyrica TaxID=433296 RepID=A0A858BUB4_9FIRM|nr:family 10 glycosylhydrolase [Aminipila butyrica]QIB69533.1 family 10 glycosylhydrolase [Aminipila butyrica]